MAIIPLRAYNREIEGLIENGQLDEAVAHCRHILSTFPKHIATYRLLGKAHLEQQRISDATDIFQRVLSAIPDDFIANVGMSIIREDENNLDASIWHMELAYEAQPSNSAIQDELLRLYSRRDGMQPPKVRLTRGALARMYVKGGLYDQAIAELRAAISEDPNRPDLQLLLSQMLFQTSQRTEAIETCVTILKKLPFCLVANQILAACLPDADRSDVSKNYRQNVVTMDPYFAHADPESISADQVPDEAVNIERLEWKSGLQVSEPAPQPTWATSLGITLEKPAEEKLPDWLQSTEPPPPAEPEEKTQPSVSPFIWDTQEVKNIITDTSKPEEEIPDWMRAAGWKPASGEAIQPPSQAFTEMPSEPEAGEGQAEKAEIPDWLRGIAPEGVSGENADTGSQTKDVSIPWLDKQQPGPTDSIIQWLEEKESGAPATPAATAASPFEGTDEEIPEWLKDLEVPFTPTAQGEQPAGSTPAFIMGTPAFLEGSEMPEPPESVEAKAPSEENIPEPSPILEAAPAETEVPKAAEVVPTEESPAALAEDIPDWLRDLAAEMPQAAPLEQVSEEVEEGVSPGFEEKVIEGEPSALEGAPKIEIIASEAGLSQPEEPTSFVVEKEEGQLSALEEMAAGVIPLISGKEEVTGELISLEEHPGEEAKVEETVAEVEFPEKAVSAEVQAPIGEIPGEAPFTEELPPAEEISETEPIVEQPVALEGIPVAAILVEEIAPVGEISEEEHAAEQPIAQEVMPEQADVVEVTPPSEEIPEVEHAAEEHVAIETPPEAVTGVEEITPLAEITEEIPSVEEPVAMEEIPEQEPVVEQPSAVEEISQKETKVEEQAPSEEIPTVEVTSEQQVTIEEIPIEKAPTPAEEQPQIEQPIEALAEIPPAPSEGEAFAWLEGLAAQQGAKEEELITPQEERPETLPDWMKPETEAAPEGLAPELEAHAEEPPAVPAQEVPEWIRGLGEAPEVEESVTEPAPTAPPEPEVAPVEELPAWLLEMAEPEEEKEAPGAVPEALEWKEEELPEWLKELAEEEAPVAEVTPIETPAVVEEAPIVPPESTSEWKLEETPVSAVIEEKPAEPAPEESSWIPETEAVVQPEIVESVTAELEPAIVAEELVPEELETPPAPPVEPVLAPVVEEVEAMHATLQDAWNAINQDHPAQAAELYTGVIKQNYRLDEVITDLQDALYRFPLDVNLWVCLGDAQFRKGDLQEALNAYTKAEELVR